MTVIAVEQIRARIGDVEHNRSQLLERTQACLSEGAQIVVFPELATSGYTTNHPILEAVAEAAEGPTFVAITEAIHAHPDALVCYGFPERTPHGIANSVVLVGRDGIVLHYRKLHLFDEEHDVFVPGDLGLPVTQTDAGKIGVCVCYDSRFVEVLRALALQDADLVLAPAAWVGGFDKAVAEDGMTAQALGLVVQANLNQVAIVAASQVGQAEPTSPRMLGGSLIVDAWGTVVLGPLSRTKPESASLSMDLDLVQTARVRGPRIHPRDDRRTDIYGVVYRGVRL